MKKSEIVRTILFVAVLLGLMALLLYFIFWAGR